MNKIKNVENYLEKFKTIWFKSYHDKWYVWSIIVFVVGSLICLNIYYTLPTYISFGISALSKFFDIFPYVLALFIYFIPYFSARLRKHNNSDAVLLLNLFFGWSCIGWLIAAIWASTDNIKK